MWIILLFSCVSVMHLNNAQHLTSSEAQIPTETFYANDGANWDSTRPPVTLTIQRGQVNNAEESVVKYSDHSSGYSFSRQAIPEIIGFNNNRDYNTYANENERIRENQFEKIFLRHPDSESNNTMPYDYLKILRKNEYSGGQVPLAPDLYFQDTNNSTSDSLFSNVAQIYSETLPNESMPFNRNDFRDLDLHRYAHYSPSPVFTIRQVSHSGDIRQNNNMNARNIYSNTKERSNNSDSTPFRTNEEIIKASPSEDHHLTHEIPQPIDFYRNPQGFFPPMVPAYFHPYPFLPLSGDGRFQAVVPFPSNSRNFDREAGYQGEHRLLAIPEKQASTQDVPDNVSENIPSETTSIVPLPPPPPSVESYPFHLFPPTIAPPIIPTPPVFPGFGVNPYILPQPQNLQRENIADETLQSLPLVPATSIPNVVPEVLPQTESLVLEERTKIITDSQENPEKIVPVEEPNEAKIPYEFGFDMNDGKGNDQHRKEISDILGVVTGSYGFRDAHGLYRLVTYIADKDGFRAFIKSNEPGVASSGSADVVVLAERPPQRTIAEEKKETESEVLVVPDTTTDLIQTGSVTE